MQLYVKGPKKQGPQRQIAAGVRKLVFGQGLWTLLKGTDTLEVLSEEFLKFLSSSLWNERRRFAAKQMPFLMIHEGMRWSQEAESVYSTVTNAES